MTKILHALILEDNPGDAELMIRALKGAGYSVTALLVENEADYRSALDAAPDVILADYTLPRFSAVAALEILRQRKLDTPFIVVSGSIGEEKAVEAMRLGADDYLLKDRLARLPAAVGKAIGENTERAARRKAEAELEALRERLKSVVSALPDVVWSIALPSLDVLYISPAAAEVFGRRPNEFYKDRTAWESLLHADDRPRMTAAWKDASPGEYQSEYRIVKPTGEVRWVQGRGRLIGDASGKAVRADGVSRDVTEFVKLHEALREREAGLRRAQIMAKLAHVITGPDGVFESWSETLPPLLGVEPERVPRSTRAWLQIMHHSDRDRLRSTAIEAGRTGSKAELEYRVQRGDGAVIHVRQTMEPLTTERGGSHPARWFNTLQDISGEVRALAELRESEGLKSAIIEASLDALVSIDETGRIIEFNPAAETIFGLAREQAFGRPMAELIMAPRHREAHARGFARHLETGEAPIFGKRLELEALRADGSEFPVELAVVPIPGRATRTFAGFIRDITQRKLAEQRIKRLNRVYAVLSGINGAIVRIRERQELFEEACRIAVGAGRFVMAWIGVVDREAALVRPVAMAGNVGNFFDGAPMAVLENKPGGHGLAGRAIRAKAPMISNDVKNDPQRLMRQELDERGINSLAIIPLIVRQEPVGALALYAAEVGAFDDDEIRLLLELAADIALALEHIERANQLEYLAYYDPLTGLANRRLFLERLQQKVLAARRTQRKLAVSIVDIERFKTINDALGRQAGDELLRQIAERITASGPDPTRVARLGADHFAIVSVDLDSEDDVARLTERRIEACLGPAFRLAGQDFRVSARIGIAMFPSDGADAEALFANAEAALKKAKAGGERYLFFAPAMTERIHESLSLENKLRQALENDEFVLHYQPKVELEARRIVGMEALIRWQSPELGLVPPIKFIPLLEETGLILEVGAWALKRAARDHRAWLEAGLNAPRVSVNVSAIQLRQRDFVRRLEEAIGGGVSPTGIDLELTESLIMEDVQASIAKLAELRRLGLGIAIDDFGTGYSSLAYLARLPVETLKIDRSFIVTMAQDASATTLVQTIISLAHSLRLKVVAEGVETEQQANMLRLLRCDQMQGYLFSKPLPCEALAALLGRA